MPVEMEDGQAVTCRNVQRGHRNVQRHLRDDDEQKPQQAKEQVQVEEPAQQLVVVQLRQHERRHATPSKRKPRRSRIGRK